LRIYKSSRSNLPLPRSNAKAYYKNTGKDTTAEFLNSDRFKGLQKSRRIEDQAKEAGVENLYNVLYRFQSMSTHGHEIGKDDHTAEAMTMIDLQAVGAMCVAIDHAGVRWLIHRQRTDNQTLRKLLALGG